jgi:hypothetical protein
MAQLFANYSADRVVVTFAGLRIQGFGDGTFLRIRPMSPGFGSKVGSDSLVSRFRNNDPRHEVEITLEQTSSSNDVLAAIHVADLAAPNGSGVSVLSIEDLEGRFTAIAEFAWITKVPDAEFGRETGQRVWMFEAVFAPGSRFDGGN